MILAQAVTLQLTVNGIVDTISIIMFSPAPLKKVLYCKIYIWKFPSDYDLFLCDWNKL